MQYMQFMARYKPKKGRNVMNSPTTSVPEELFELCKEVYGRTSWDDDDLLHYLGGEVHFKRLFESDMFHLGTTRDTYAPLYTSDYLLEKLGHGAGVYKDSTGYTAHRPTMLGAPENKDPLNGRVGWHGKTPAAAILTMVKELLEKGLLDAKKHLD